MNEKYINLCRQLIDLGYNYTLKPDSFLLVEKLFGDLLETTASLRKYMIIAQEAVEERDHLKFGAEPYKCDNAKLVKQCNELHSNLIQVEEQNEKQQKELKKRILKLEKEREEFIDCQKKLRERVREFELQAARKSDRNFQNQLRQSGSANLRCSSSATSLGGSKQNPKSRNFEINSAMTLADQKISNLVKEVGQLKNKQLELTETNQCLKNKVLIREKEIQRLMEMLNGGRPLDALNNDCCYKDVNKKMSEKQDKINCLQKLNSDLEHKLQEARCKQHEAMKNALQLAERNKELENEMKDIDDMALAVEQECNSNVKNTNHKVKRLQNRMHDTLLEFQNLEKQVKSLKREKQSLVSDLNAIKIEKNHLQSILEKTLDDKKILHDKINKLTIIEKDLNDEIDRLMTITSVQKQTIAELKCKTITNPMLDNEVDSSEVITIKDPKKSSRKSPHESGTEYRHFSSDTLNVCNPDACIEKLKSIISEEINKRYPKTDSLERVKKERDFYIKEHQALIEKFREAHCTSPKTSGSINKRLLEKEESIRTLQNENQILSKEKHHLMSRLETVRDYADDGDMLTIKSSMKRMERERDLLKADLERMEEERDSLKQKLKSCLESHSVEIEKYRKEMANSENELRKSEQEIRDLLHNQGTRKSSVTQLEEQCNALKKELKSTQAELLHQKTLYQQLRILQEQADKTLANSQSQLKEAEKELSSYKYKYNTLNSETNTSSTHINTLKKDLAIMQRNLNEMEKEKDNILTQLDDKTEQIAAAQQELNSKDGKIQLLENSLKELKKQVSLTVDNKIATESQLKNTSSEITLLRTELQNAIKSKDAANFENRRLQEELTACIGDNRKCRNELDLARRQIEDLKRQLQQYVAEVKRIEDLMTHKEIERSEMLDQFRSLSHEATVLESNNHSLEHEATQSKVQLTVALDHASDLERKLDDHTTMKRDYEKQILELTSKIASLEIQLNHCKSQFERNEEELSTMQELCFKLDKQKETLTKKLQEEENLREEVERNLHKHRRDSDVLKKVLEKDQHTVQSLESLLAENRQQAVEQRLINQDLQSEINRLKAQIKEMENNLVHTTECLDVYQQKALQYSHQNKQLRRDITNERFYLTDDSSSQKKYPSL